MPDTGLNGHHLGCSDGVRRQLGNEVAHWQQAVDALADLDEVASPQAWASLEDYLQRRVRDRLAGVVRSLRGEAEQLQGSLRGVADDRRVRRDLLRLRARYLQVETILDFYGDAINARSSPRLRRLLAGFDTLATDSMAASLVPVGVEPVPALVYVDKGLGAAILRAGVRLWDQGHPSPAAAIKLTRHNLWFPTALFHETGHQVNNLTGWNLELADALHATLAPRSRVVAELWRSWAGEIAADVHAFAQVGWAPTAALANVVDGPTSAVYRIRPGDPHPYPLVRVAFNVACCRSWFGAGPWDDIAHAWAARHPVERAPRDVAAITQISLAAIGDLVDTCTRRPMAAFRGAPLSAVLDPRRVAPSALAGLERRAGGSLLTSTYLRRQESLRILAVLSTRRLSDRRDAAGHGARLHRWIGDLGADAGRHRSTALTFAA